MTIEEPPQEATHPVATSEHPRMIGRRMLILFGAVLLAGAASAFYWVF
jgi:hypothetical protein